MHFIKFVVALVSIAAHTFAQSASVSSAAPGGSSSASPASSSAMPYGYPASSPSAWPTGSPSGYASAWPAVSATGTGWYPVGHNGTYHTPTGSGLTTSASPTYSVPVTPPTNGGPSRLSGSAVGVLAVCGFAWLL